MEFCFFILKMIGGFMGWKFFVGGFFLRWMKKFCEMCFFVFGILKKVCIKCMCGFDELCICCFLLMRKGFLCFGFYLCIIWNVIYKEFVKINGEVKKIM